jgi:hypothetical protein
MPTPTGKLKQLVYRAPELQLSKKLPFRYRTAKEVWLMIRQRRYAKLVKAFMELQQIVIEVYKGKLYNRQISRKTKKQTNRKMTVKQARAINRGRAKAGLKRIDFKVLKK